MQSTPNINAISAGQYPESAAIPLNDERLISRVDTSNVFGLPIRFLEMKAVTGGGPVYYKIGRRVYYRVADVRRWIEAQRVNSTSEGEA
jgi:hypothetical protein